MKVSQIPYERYTYEQYEAEMTRLIEAVKNASGVEDIWAAYDKYKEIAVEYQTAASLANCRFTLNTRDEFYNAEMAYYDQTGPLCSKLDVDLARALIESPYRKEAEAKIHPRIIKSFELHLKSFSEAVVEDCQLENAISTEYSKFMGELVFEYEGEKMPLSVLRGKLQDEDREVRRKVAIAIGTTLQANAETLDDIFDRLVKVRDRIAKKLGYKNFVELGYYRMGRLDYDADMVARFRDNVAKDLVPLVSELKAKIASKLGIDRVMFYDDAVTVTGDVPKPVIGTKEIFEQAQIMYDDMNPEVGDFMRRMLAAEAFDVEARDGKFGGGYCTTFPKYNQPFILANFNGTSGDVDVITHEFGHALAFDFLFKYSDYMLPIGMETCECHSMSMEFLCWKGTERFFGDLADKYHYTHLMDALSFIPYGTIVDEFQHVVYDNPELTPAQRKEAYLALEKKYRPYLSFEGIPYLDLGTRWQYQMHIYESPFYYIDYCLAQTVAVSFLLKSLKDYDGALNDYLTFLKNSGTVSFDELVKQACIASPFEEGALRTIAENGLGVIESIEKTLG